MNSSGSNQTCILCQKAEAMPTGEIHEDSGVQYTLLHCSSCGGEFWLPCRNPGAEWYRHDERYADRNDDPILTPNQKHRGVLDFLKGRKGSVLDIGCGVGNFLAPAKEQGWDTWGIDFDRDAIQTAQRTFGLTQLSVNDLETFRKTHSGKKFDLVTFFDVFEHIDNHKEFLADVREVLVPDGLIALSVPYRHGWSWLIPHDLPPRHLTRWDISSLTYILERNGFEVITSKRLPAPLYYLIMKIRFKYGKFLSFGLVRRIKRTTGDTRRKKDFKERTRQPLKVRVVHIFAKLKDGVFFGIPALIIWCMLLCSRKRYTDFYLVAKDTRSLSR